MKNCCLLFLMSVSLSISNKDGRAGQLNSPQEIHYSVRMLNLTTIDSTGQSYVEDMKWIFLEMKQYLSATVIFRKTYLMHRIMFHFDRCRDLEFACEDFHTFSLTKICPYLRMQNQFWSTGFDSIKPKFFLKSCPRLERGTYTMENVTVDTDSVIMFYNEALKYYWKLHVYFYNEKNQLEHQFHIHLHFRSYNKRSRDK